MNETLKPCMFCEDIEHVAAEEGDTFSRVMCFKCYAKGPITDAGMDDAVTLWNAAPRKGEISAMEAVCDAARRGYEYVKAREGGDISLDDALEALNIYMESNSALNALDALRGNGRTEGEG